MMGANDKIYLVEIGKQARMKDIVHIWDYAEYTQERRRVLSMDRVI